MARDLKSGPSGGPMDRLKAEARGLVGALGERALASVQDKLADATDRMTEYVEGGGGPGLMAAVTGAKNLAEGKGPVRSMLGAGVKGLTEKVRGLFGKGGKGKQLKMTNIVESIDVGVPIDLAYNQWTQFSDFSGFMKKVENVDQNPDEPGKLHWKAQVLWSHREWDADIIEQVPEDRIIWRSEGAKGHVNGAVTFHELAPGLTRILVVLEYHPQGLFEHTGNLWRAQGRRARLELKHFERHVMTNAILHPEEIEGWRGVIEDGEVVKDHEEALEEEQDGAEEPAGREQDDEFADEEYAYGRGENADDEDLDDEFQEAGDEREDERTADDEAGVDEEYEEGEEADEDEHARRRSAPSTGDGARTPRRGRPKRPGQPRRSEERPQRTTRRRAGLRGGQ